METEDVRVTRRRYLLAFALASAATCGVCGAPSPAAGQVRVDRMEADRKALAVVEGIWQKSDQKKGLRALRYKDLLPRGVRVTPAFGTAGKELPVLTCERPCWFFFVDEDPKAHFAHPVTYLVVDAESGEVRTLRTDWWPLVDGKAVFSKFRERADPESVIFERASSDSRGEKPKLPPGGGRALLGTHSPCSAWAVIVCGYDDLPDTFDEDTDGMYQVLIGLGVPDDHVFFVSPHTTHPGVDRPLSAANVQWAVNEVAAHAGEHDKALFFYSSHGGIDSLTCGASSIPAASLSSWLAGVNSQELTVVVEACHSGSLIGRYKDGTYLAAEDDLTGHGETNRAVFTSASTDTSSYPDLDGPDDPNPGDSGSETIWGYVEAFSTSAADSSGDGEISFGEAWQYAWNNDVSRIRGSNTPQMTHTGLDPATAYNYCYRIGGPRDLFVSDGPGDVGHNSYDYDSTDIWVTQDPMGTDHQDVVSGMDNYVHVAVHNRGTSPIANGTLQAYWADTSAATSWPGDFHPIGVPFSYASLPAEGTATQTWTWAVDPSIGLGHHFCLVAIADSPDDPSTGGPAGVTYVAPFDNNIGQKNITIIHDPGHGLGTFDFALKNNTKAPTVDLVARWVGKPWGSVLLLLPDDLVKLVKEGRARKENLEWAKLPDGREALEMGLGETARVGGIPLQPGDKRVVSVMMHTADVAPGGRHAVRLVEEVEGRSVGAVTARLHHVRPNDCGWVARANVEAFSDLAARHRVPEAKEIVALFARVVSRGCCGDSEWRELLGRALPMERKILGSLPKRTNPTALQAMAEALEDLAKSLERGRLGEAIALQGRVAEVARGL
jgi:hypothetical protein